MSGKCTATAKQYCKLTKYNFTYHITAKMFDTNNLGLEASLPPRTGSCLKMYFTCQLTKNGTLERASLHSGSFKVRLANRPETQRRPGSTILNDKQVILSDQGTQDEEKDSRLCRNIVLLCCCVLGLQSLGIAHLSHLDMMENCQPAPLCLRYEGKRTRVCIT